MTPQRTTARLAEALQFVLGAYESHRERANKTTDTTGTIEARAALAEYAQQIENRSTLPLLTPDRCHQTTTGTPAALAMYAADVQGPKAIAEAVTDLQIGRRVHFAICHRDPEGTAAPPRILEIVTLLAIPDRACIRYGNGPSGEPMAAGTSTFAGSIYADGSPTDLDPVELAAGLAAVLASRSPWCFRLRADEAAR